MKNKFFKILIIVLVVVILAALITEFVLLYGSRGSDSNSVQTEEACFTYYDETVLQ